MGAQQEQRRQEYGVPFALTILPSFGRNRKQPQRLVSWTADFVDPDSAGFGFSDNAPHAISPRLRLWATRYATHDAAYDHYDNATWPAPAACNHATTIHSNRTAHDYATPTHTAHDYATPTRTAASIPFHATTLSITQPSGTCVWGILVASGLYVAHHVGPCPIALSICRMEHAQVTTYGETSKIWCRLLRPSLHSKPIVPSWPEGFVSIDISLSCTKEKTCDHSTNTCEWNSYYALIRIIVQKVKDVYVIWWFFADSALQCGTQATASTAWDSESDSLRP